MLVPAFTHRNIGLGTSRLQQRFDQSIKLAHSKNVSKAAPGANLPDLIFRLSPARPWGSGVDWEHRCPPVSNFLAVMKNNASQ